jgi:AcrR family transcriptional regulator
MNVKPNTEESPPRSRKAEQSEATRAELVKVARRLFAQRGYGDVATEEIVRAAGVTRGALYHHFTDKRDLFRAVYEEVESDLTQRIAAEALKTATNPLEGMRAASSAFLDACMDDPEVQRITLLDAPAVLGWEEWREIGTRYGLGLIQASLQAAMDEGLIDEHPVKPLAHILLGSLDEAALVVARADDDGQTRAEVGEALDRFLNALVTAHAPSK